MRNVLKTLVAVCFLGVVGCGGAAAPEVKSGADASNRGGEHAEVGKQAPDLSIQTLNGRGKIDTAQGKILVVDFWATWCQPCRSSFPQLEALSKKSGDRVTVVGVSVDDEKTDILNFAKETGATFPIGWDEGHTLAERWSVNKMPTTFILDGSGKVRYVHAGYHDGEAAIMEKELNALADEGPSNTRLAKADVAPKSDVQNETASAPPAESKLEAATKDDTKTEAVSSPMKKVRSKKGTPAKPKAKKPGKGPKKTTKQTPTETA